VKRTEFNRTDWKSIESFVTPGAKVLDLGCGDGALLDLLRRNRRVHARGVEIDQKNILACIEKGISVFQSDLDEGLTDYGDKSFDFVILSFTLQVVYDPRMLLKEMMRVGRKVIVSIPNFGHWEMRFRLFFQGCAPKSRHLPFEWYDTPNIRTATMCDFVRLCDMMGIRIESVSHTCMTRNGLFAPAARLLPNLFSEVSVFLLS
jgi:methionine biosynthesis protein MetW